MGYLGGVVEADDYRRNHFKKVYTNIKFFKTVEDSLIDLGEFDAFIVATPASTHFKIAKILIENNKHVLVEKPFTLNSYDAKILDDLASEKNITLMVGHVFLFHPAFIKIKQLIENGTLGKIQYLYSNRLNLGTIRFEEDVFWSFAPHDIALFQWLIGTFPEHIDSNGVDIIQKEIHDTSITTLKYSQNIMGHIYVSWLHPFKEHRFVVIGSKGMISFEDSLKNRPLTFYDKTIIWDNGVPVPQDKSEELIDFDSTMPLENELRYFIEHFEEKKIDKCTGQSAIEVVKILEKASKRIVDR